MKSIAINIHSHAIQIETLIDQRPDFPTNTLFPAPQILDTGVGSSKGQDIQGACGQLITSERAEAP